MPYKPRFATRRPSRGKPALMTCEALKELIETGIEDAKCRVFDLTGTSDHFEVQVESPAFEGKSLIEQHKMVHQAVGMHLTTTIHALKIKTSTPKTPAS